MTSWRWHLAHGRHLELGETACVMGVLNVTPDSFSDGGRFDSLGRAVEGAARMAQAGAVIIDVGGESTRPGATPVAPGVEQARVLPVIEALAAAGDLLISIDTYHEETARLAIAAGAHIVNDVWGLQRESGIATVAAESGAGLVIMHTSRARTKAADVIADQLLFLRSSLEIAAQSSVALEQVVLDPGFGFGKEPEENLQIMARFAELQQLGFPLLVGTSRKRFLGDITGREVHQRDAATAATSVLLRFAGAAIFRVHDVATNVDALAVADAVLARTTSALRE